MDTLCEHKNIFLIVYLNICLCKIRYRKFRKIIKSRKHLVVSAACENTASFLTRRFSMSPQSPHYSSDETFTEKCFVPAKKNTYNSSVNAHLFSQKINLFWALARLREWRAIFLSFSDTHSASQYLRPTWFSLQNGQFRPISTDVIVSALWMKEERHPPT